MTKEEEKELLAQAEKETAVMRRGAIALANQFKNAAPEGKKWFKPIHILKIATDETEETIELKLKTLVSLELAAVRNDNGTDKYMITLTNEDKVSHLQEYIEHLDAEKTECLRQIKSLSK